MQRQCELLGLPRSTYYYQPRPESAENLRLLSRLDELYMEYPFFGSRRLAITLEVNRKRIQRLMRILGIEALYPKPNLSRPAPGHEVYPYLLRGVSIERPNQVWSTYHQRPHQALDYRTPALPPMPPGIYRSFLPEWMVLLWWISAIAVQWRRLIGGYGNAGMRPERRLKPGVDGGLRAASWSAPLHHLRTAEILSK